MDALQQKVQKLKRAVKVYAKRLKANEGDGNSPCVCMGLFVMLSGVRSFLRSIGNPRDCSV